MKNSKSKGDLLERAVYMIQETLLESDPKLKGVKFTIEPKKRLKKGESHHEVDLYVVIQPGTQVESVVFFECKNWAKPVTNTEVMVLQSKVELFGAARGVLVAPSITKGALSLLHEYKKIQYRKCEHNFGELSLNAIHVTHEPSDCIARVTKRHAEAVHSETLGSICCWNGAFVPFRTQIDRWIDEIAKKDRIELTDTNASESAHWREIKWRREFQPDEFTLAGIDIAAVELEVTFWATVRNAPPKYMSCVEGHGRYATFDIISPDFPGRIVNIEVVGV